MISSGAVHFRYIAVEGPIGAGKTSLAERLGTRLDAALVLEEDENPFLADFYADRPGAALQAQLFYLLSRHRQQTSLRQADLFSQVTISDYLFDRDKIFAYLNLDDNELFIYQRLYDLLARDAPPPDLVIYLQAPTDVLLRRIRSRGADTEAAAFNPDPEYLKELNEAYHHFFFHYTATPLLVVETSQFDSDASDEGLDDLVKQIRTMGAGTRYYVPRTQMTTLNPRSLSVQRTTWVLRSLGLGVPRRDGDKLTRHGLVQEGPQADRPVRREGQPGARRAVGQVPRMFAGYL